MPPTPGDKRVKISYSPHPTDAFMHSESVCAHHRKYWGLHVRAEKTEHLVCARPCPGIGFDASGMRPRTAMTKPGCPKAGVSLTDPASCTLARCSSRIRTATLQLKHRRLRVKPQSGIGSASCRMQPTRGTSSPPRQGLCEPYQPDDDAMLWLLLTEPTTNLSIALLPCLQRERSCRRSSRVSVSV